MVFEPICRFAEGLRRLLRLDDPTAFVRAWADQEPEVLGWTAVATAWRRDSRICEVALTEVDALLLNVLDHLDALTAQGGDVADQIDVFRRAELERLHHATAAALVALRFGTAGLQTVVEDRTAPRARRYFALLASADRHAPNLWPMFRRYLEPNADHAFQAVAVEAARFYPSAYPTPLLTGLFDAVRNDSHRRAFLSPRILESLFVLNDFTALGFWQDLLVGGYTHPDPEWCEVTRALVMVRRLTGRIAPNAKFPDQAEDIDGVLDDAEEVYRTSAFELHPVTVI